MAWYKKAARMIPFSSPVLQDPYSQVNKDNPRMPRDKDRFNDLSGFGGNIRGTSVPGAGVASGDMSGEDLNPADNISSDPDTDELRDEGPGGTEHPRAGTNGGYPWLESNVMFGDEVGGTINDMDIAMAGDRTAHETALRNYEEFQRRRSSPSRTVRVRNQDVTIL